MTDKRQWLRLYADIVDDDKLGLLAFQDRWHYVAILALKASGLLDDDCDGELKRRRIAYKLGVTELELDELARRLSAVDLIDRLTLQPLAWNKRQFENDSSAERTKRWRERKKDAVTPCDGHGNVTVTPPDTETDTDTEKATHTPPARDPADGPDAEPAAVQPTAGALATRAMIDAGMSPSRVNPSHAELVAALGAGVTSVELADVVRECLARGGAPPAMVYVIRTALGRRCDAKSTANRDPDARTPTSRSPRNGRAPRSAIERQIAAIHARRAQDASAVPS